ncbi:hypothetical protein CDO73_02615 [Saccharibacillus sp. O23]|nr:hypothetical protein CDO73_02615 [Saccharibacillus sp. O23]
MKYDSIQLSFDSDRREDQLRSIHVYFSDNVEFPESLKIKGWVPYKDMEFKKFMHEIETFKVQLLRDDKHTLENTQLGFRSQAGVVLIFVIEGEMARLDSFHLSDF